MDPRDDPAFKPFFDEVSETLTGYRMSPDHAALAWTLGMGALMAVWSSEPGTGEEGEKKPDPEDQRGSCAPTELPAG